MDNSEYRKKLGELLQIIRVKNQEIATLKATQENGINPAAFVPNATINATCYFCSILEQVECRNLVVGKKYQTANSQSSVEVCYTDFKELLRSIVPRNDVAIFKLVTTSLNFVDNRAYTGGQVSRIDGISRRVVRIPRDVYNLFSGGVTDGGAQDLCG